ncbi:MAG: rane protein [Myxococcales bacterium]|nr:rane protein [Myxococcales bacterium]
MLSSPAVNTLIAWSTRWPRTVVAAVVILAVLAFVGTSRLQNEEDLMVFLPQRDPDVQLFKDVSQRFGALRVALIGVEAPAGDDVFSTASVEKITRATQAIKNVRGVDLILSITAVSDIVPGPMGAQVVDLVPSPPADAAAARALRDKVLSREFAAGNLVSRDGRAALIMAFLADPSTLAATSAATGNSRGKGGELGVEEQIRTAALKELGGMTVYFGGAPYAARSIYQEAQADVWHLSPVALFMLFLVVILAFRDPVGVGLTLGSVALSVVVVLGAMGWLGDKFTVASSTLPVILFASGSSYAVHVLGRYYLLRADRSPAEAIAEALRIVGPPLAIAAGTTSVGFFAFVTSEVRPWLHFGIACGSGVLVCWLTSLTLVPAVIALFPRKAHEEVKLVWLGNALVATWHWAMRHRRAVLVAALMLGALTVGPMLKVKVRMEPRAFYRVGSDPWLADKFLDEHFGGGTFAQIWLTGDFDDPATLRELARLSDFARGLPGVKQVASVLLPLTLATDGMDGLPVLPWKRSQAANLYLFIEGQAGVRQLITPERHDVLLNIRMHGDPWPAIAELERFARAELRRQPRPPTVEDVADRLSWQARAYGKLRAPKELLRTVKPLAAPGLLDPEWTKKRSAIIDEFFASEEAPPLDAAARKQIAGLAAAAPEGSPELAAALAKAAPSPEEGNLGYQFLTTRLGEEHRRLAVERAVPLLIDAAGLPTDGPDAAFVRAHVFTLADDLFVRLPADEHALQPLTARVAGEPILDRGFSRAVEHDQIRALLLTIACVLLMMLALFRSLRLALLSMAPSLLTLAIIFGGMGMLRIPIDLGTSLVAGICTGAGADFAMHYLWYLRRQSADEVSRTVGPVMVVSIVLVSLGFWVLALGKSPVMHLFGGLAGLSMSLSAALTCLLVPAVLNKVRT